MGGSFGGFRLGLRREPGVPSCVLKAVPKPPSCALCGTGVAPTLCPRRVQVFSPRGAVGSAARQETLPAGIGFMFRIKSERSLHPTVPSEPKRE